MRAADVVRALRGNPNGQGFLCRCPVPSHGRGRGDLTPSLSVADGDKGLIVNCHGGCDPLDVLAELRRRGLAGGDEIKPNGAKAANPNTIRTISYDYCDPETGEVRYRKERYERDDGSKTFAIKPKGRGGSPPLLYGGERLADLGEGEPLWIVEGERKVDRLRALRAIAVSGDTGHQSKWLPAHAELLRGLPVILWPDSDAPGEKYIANAAAAILADNPAADLRVIRPFGPPDGAKGRDVCDWTGNADQLLDLAAGAGAYVRAGSGNPVYQPPSEPPRRIVAKPYVYRDPKTIPPRQFLHAGHYVRGFLSATITPGGLGKTSLQLVEAIGMAIGRDLLAGTTARPLKVWYWNLEDPKDEIERRIAAILLHYKIDPAKLDGQLFVNSDEPLVIATKIKDATVVAEPVVNDLTAEMLRLGIDTIIVDPFVSSHKVPENDNGAIDTVAKTWSGIARTCNSASELAHHIRKPSSGSTSEITVDDARGAGSLKDAGRSVRVLNTMSKEDAESIGIKPDQRRRYFRVDAGKANMKPPAENTEWRTLISVPLDNGTTEHEGDWVGVVTVWKMPGALEGVTTAHLFRVQKHISEGKWRENSQAKAWAGKAVAEVLGLDVREPAVKKRIAGMLKTWIAAGALKVVEDEDETRHKFDFVEIGEWAI